MIRAFKVLYAVAYVTYKEWVAYRSHMLVSLFVGPAYFLIQYFIWHAFFLHNETINGFTLQQMLSYYGVMTLIKYCIMDFADWNLQMLIRTGRFITFILRPVSHQYFAFSQKVGHRILGFTLEFIPVYILFYFVFGIFLIPASFMWAIISIILGFIMMFLVNYSVGITGFWLIRTEGIRRMFILLSNIFTGVFLPLTFFPLAFQKILFFLPFQYILYVPVRVFLGSYKLAGIQVQIPHIVALQAVAVLIMWGFSRLLWRFGIRRFTGVGV
ncbi:MAG: ABC-2 family transporter protein [Actinomycetia bacterium]|nr:ABC-2 family transporter protein [Actinomycetes bacterium]